MGRGCVMEAVRWTELWRVTTEAVTARCRYRTRGWHPWLLGKHIQQPLTGIGW